VTLSALFSSMAAGLTTGLGVYFNFYLWGFSTDQSSLLALTGIPAVVIALLVAPPLSAAMGKRNACIAMAVLSVSATNTPFLLKFAGWTPPDGSPALFGVIFTATLIAVTLGLVALILYFSMIADVVEDSQLATGRRAEGLFFAASSFIQKAVSGIGVFASGLMLSLVRFPEGAKPGAVDPAIVRHLAMLYVPIQVVLYLVTMLLLSAYRIDRQSHQDTLRKLSEAAPLV
jgi:Na+/melibiose symporter-like transporter